MRDKVDNVKQVAEHVTKPAVKPAAGPGSDCVDLIHAVMHQLRSRQFQALREGPHGLTHMDSKVLGFFGRHPGATLSDLAQHSGRDKAQLARLVAGLRERGLLEGAADEADRRSVRLSLTAQGKALQRALQQQHRRLSAAAVDGFSEAELAQLQALLLRMQGNLGRG